MSAKRITDLMLENNRLQAMWADLQSLCSEQSEHLMASKSLIAELQARVAELEDALLHESISPCPECEEQCRLLAMGGEREARLLARVAELESDLAAKAHLIELLLAEKRKAADALVADGQEMGDYDVPKTQGGDYIGEEEAQEALQVGASAGVPVESLERQP